MDYVERKILRSQSHFVQKGISQKNAMREKKQLPYSQLSLTDFSKIAPKAVTEFFLRMERFVKPAQKSHRLYAVSPATSDTV